MGADLDVSIPGMKYASASLYHAFDDNTDDDQQITLTYGWGEKQFRHRWLCGLFGIQQQ